MDTKKRFDRLNSAIGTTAETSLLFYRAAKGAGATDGEATHLLQAYIAAMAFGKERAQGKASDQKQGETT